MVISTVLAFFFISPIYAYQLKALLPGADEVRPWQPRGETESYVGEELYNLINGGAEIFLEYGFTEAVAQEYSREDSSFRLTIYRMGNAEAAFGIYSLNRMRKPLLPGIGDEGVGEDNYLCFWQGSYYVTVEAFPLERELEESLRRLASLVSARIGEHASLPHTLDVLPQKNRIDRSECLVKGLLGVSALLYISDKDIFQLSPQGAGVYGEYQFPGEKVKLFIARYTTPDKAEEVWQRLQEALNEKEGFIPRGEIDRISLWQKEENFYAALKTAHAVALVVGAVDKAHAIALLQQIK
ncbi:hypothetical protein CEE39_07005 [bacterium (candidate division B38) B3_B38]|nr:MAG: hypothetical protein CEE39_07005 [bacterium (candidate division B38) B3_B38]